MKLRVIGSVLVCAAVLQVPSAAKKPSRVLLMTYNTFYNHSTANDMTTFLGRLWRGTVPGLTAAARDEVLRWSTLSVDQWAADGDGTITGYDGGTTDLHLGPTTFGLAYCDHVVVYRFAPRGQYLTDCEITWLVNESAVEGRDYRLADLIWLWDVTTLADKQIIERNQAGVQFDPLVAPSGATGRKAHGFSTVLTFDW